MKLPKFKEEKKQNEKLNKISNPETGSALEREREREVNFTRRNKKVISYVTRSFVAVILIAFLLINVMMLSQNNNSSIQVGAADPELEVARTYGEVEDKDEETQSEYVRFVAYFARDLDGDGYAEKVKGTCKEVEGEDTLYMSLNVLGNGYLKNGRIEIEEDNMYFQTTLVDDETIKGNYISENTTTINLKDIQAGTQKLIFGQVRSGDYRYTSSKKDVIGNDSTKYSGINKIKLTGIHVADDGTETKIEKEIELPVDWYGTTNTEIPYTYGGNGERNKYQNYNTEGIVDEENKEINLEFKIVSQESNNKLLLSKSTIDGTIPEFNGYKATKLEITGDNVEYTFDEETGNFSAYRDSEITEDGIVEKEAYTSSWNTARYSEFKLKVTYPLEAYDEAVGTIVLNIPVKATFEGYNNTNEEFENPYVSNIAEDIITITYERGGGDVIDYDIQVGTWVPAPYNVYVVSKENAVKYYNQVQDDTRDTYEVRWYVYRGNSGEIANVSLREQDENYTDKFLKTDNTYDEMLKYSKNIGIYFTTAGAMFGENGWIKVYNDETDELIHEFTSEDWETYTKENPYMYDKPIEHIRIETSEADKVSSFTATSIKEIDNETLTKDYSRKEFDRLNKIYSYLSGYAKYSEEEEYRKLKDDIGIANYDEPLSIAVINNITPTTLSTQETVNMDITINTINLGYNVREWQNGTFLLKFPEEVLVADINDVSINNGNVSLLGYDIYQENGNYYLKILTENEEPETYSITIDAEITPDPRVLTATRSIELYAYNEECNNYKDSLRTEDIYDLNGDENTEDLVNHTTSSITFVGPTSLVTSETGSDYNDGGDKLSTAVAPQVAEIDKTQNDRTAKIKVQITNNYSGNISEVLIVGKTPFEGNTSQLLGQDLGSTYTAEMTGPMELPEELQDIATVYYSENEIVNNDINDSSNNWKTADQVTDYSSIKSYAIDLGDYVLEKGESHICTYEIKVPLNLEYNDVAYSSHAVYFYLETDEGKLYDRTETNKLGFMIAKKFNISLEKFKENTDTHVQSAIFNIIEEGQNESKIGITDSTGTFTIEDLYVERVYTLKEIRNPSAYEKMDEEVQFKVVVQDDELQLEIISGEEILKDYSINQATEDENGNVKFVLENKPKYKVILRKKDQEDGSNIAGVKFILEGEGLGTGRTVTTGENGTLNLTGLSQEVEYTLTELEADGYYVNETPVKFKVENDSGDLQFVVTSGSFASYSDVEVANGLTGTEAQDTVEVELTNEKIPTYQISIKKYEQDEDITLRGAEYKITGEGIDKDGETYTTDENGTITIPNLYEYVEGKNITGIYTLEEIRAPEGYALDSRQIQFKAQRNAEGELQLTVLGENFLRNSSVEGDIINLELEDEPLFKIIKLDGTSKLPVANAKFIIKEIDEDYVELGYAQDNNGNIIGNLTQIEGEEVPVVETDENGEISYGLKLGLYKATEIEAPEGYVLSENEEDRTYYFGIGEARGPKIGVWFRDPLLMENEKSTSPDEYYVAGREDGKALYYHNGLLSIINADNQLEKSIESEQVFCILSRDDGFDVLTDSNLIQYNDNLEIINSFNITTGMRYFDRAEDGSYIVTGSFTGSKTIDSENRASDNNLSGSGSWTIQSSSQDIFVLKVNSSGKVEFITNYGGTGNEVPTYVQIMDNGNYLISSHMTSTTIYGDMTDSGDDIVGKFTDSFFIVNQDTFKISELTSVKTTRGNVTLTNGSLHRAFQGEGGSIYYTGQLSGSVTFNADETVSGEDITVTSTGSTDAYVVKYNSEGKVIWAVNVGGTGIDHLYSSEILSDGEILLGGDSERGGITVSADKTSGNREIISEPVGDDPGTWRGIALKIDNDGKVVWINEFGYSPDEGCYAVSSFTENTYALCGFETLDTGTKEGNPVLIRVDEQEIGPAIPESSEITIENFLERFNITTDVIEIDGVKGGTISGEDETPYEEVEYGKESLKDIIITPDEDYKILKITINGKEIDFTPEDDGSVILNKFTNVTSDKHIEVEFSKSVSSVIVHHYKYGTTDPYESLAEDETIRGNIGTNYTTTPKDIENYEVVIEELPENSSGVYTEDVQEVIYWYKEAPVKFIVNHYIEGTEEIVPGSEDDQINEERERGTEYTTSPATNIDEKYELVATPNNATGTLTENEIVVTYYYRVKDSAGVIVHHIDIDTKEQIAPDVIIPVSGIGKYGDSYTTKVSSEIPANYEYITRTDNWEGTMVDTLTEVTYEYKLIDPGITDQNISKTVTANTGTSNLEIEYGITYTTNIENYIGKAQVTIVDNLPYKIDVSKSTLNGGTYDEQNQTITWVELVDGIDTYENPESGGINIIKTIKVVYTDVDSTKASIENEVTGKVKLFTPEKTSDEVKDTAIIEAEIDQVKLMSTENNLDYVVPGEKIIYTIIAKNSGGLDKNVVIKDTIPTGTTFVDDSIKVNSLSSFEVNGETVDFTQKTADDLANGITLNVPKGSSTAEGFVRLSFEVTVNSDTTGEIINTATVDNEPTNEVSKPVLTTEKVSSVIRNDETSDLAENEVTVNDQVRYTVRVTNTGTTTVNDVEVQDTIPSGTKLISIDNEGTQEDDEITWNIASIAGGETQEVSFTVKVEYAKDNFTITNVATVDGKETNETENPYEKPDPELESTLTKNGTDKVTSVDQVVNYEVKFTASIDDFKGTAKVTIVDTLPYAIDISSSKLDNGTYNSENNTITWEEEIDVDTFSSDETKDIVITKSIEVVYLYGDINATTGSMLNTVDSKIELIETEGEEPVLTDEKEAEKETLIEIPAEVKVHHYLYDKETDTYTTVKLAPDETINGLVGQEYTTSKSSQVPSNYSCVNKQPNNYQGKMTEETIEVNYYYSLITPTITNTIDKAADPSVLTTEGEEVTYNIRYTASIDNYIGKATVSIVDTLPAEIDIEKSDLNGGVYNSTNKTITWEEEISSIDTFTNETYNYEFEKSISLVYTGQNMAEDLSNTVVGTVNVYYPENHPTKPGEVQETKTAEDTAVVEQDYKVDLKVEKVWDDNNNEKGHRPDGIMVTIAGGDLDNVQVELNDSNNWSYELEDLDKYDENGNLINYSVAESEKNSGDLQYYSARLTELSTDDPSVKSYRFTNTYKLTQADLDADITKTGTEEITSSNDVVNYEINFTSTVKDYIGYGKVIITDTLPYRIDTVSSSLDGGTYDDEAKTITWEEDLNNIDTFANGDYNINITKNISVVFVDLDASASSFTNTVLGKVRLYETEQEDQATDETDTLININGDVIVKYVDIDTGEEISDREEIEGKVGDKYTTEQKQIDTYEFVKSTPNTEGNITEETQEVIYYYQRKEATVIVKYQDTDGNELTDDVIIDGKVGDEYTTEQKEFENYEFVSVTDNANGTMTEDTITVIYVYQKIPTKVIVKYLEKGTDKQLALDDEIDGFVGDDYSTDRKAIKNYQSAEPEPDNKSGTMTKDTITVIYYYEKIPAGDVIVKYVDIDTDEEILYKDPETGEDKTYGYTISGHVGDNYEAEQKDIPYYNFIRSTSNTTGQLTEAGDTVIYYYQKQSFNLGITKSISEITLDGSSKGVGDGKNTKVEIHRKKINTADLEVKYKIVVSNTGEISGTAKVIDALPSGYIVSSNNPTYWTSSNGNLETQVELQPGESKELEVVLKWVNGESSFGTGENIARITDINNPANYAETTQKDNEDKATIVTSVETGINRNVYLIITTYLLMIGLVVLLYLYEQYQKERRAEIVPKKKIKIKLPDNKK